MKGSECRLIEYMEGSKKRFIIPVYQRNYDWKIENCKQLYNDLIKIIKYNRKSHFFGSLVSVYEPSGRNTEFLVIDGQQRLTTVSLLLLAMYNLIEKGIISPENPTLGKEIYEDFLVDKYQPQEKRIKLKPVKNDQIAFGRLFENEKEYIVDSNLTSNYQYFYERIQKNEISIDELFDAICSLEIINITLNSDDNPQLIFESLNSTGLELSEGDKIRNYILMGLETNLQNEYYEKYWNHIEVCTKYDVSSFIRDYLSIKNLAIPSQKKIYISFKEYVENTSIDIESLLKDLLAYAKRYETLLLANTNDKALNACIYRLNRLETTVTRPFFLEVLRMYDENKLSLSQVTEIFIITETYIFRRTICELPTNALNKIFLLLHKEIIRFDGTEDDYLEKFKYALLSKKDRARLPDNNEFKMNFSERPVYQMNSKNKVYILERFENFGTAEVKDVYNLIDDGTYTIEHIMPQHLTPAWIRDLGEDYEQIQTTWLHRIANLTLTAYNSRYSNNTFNEKKTMKNGFIESGLRMNTYIARLDKWSLPEIEERNDYLMNRALEIWEYPTTEFKPIIKQLDTYSLDDDTDLTGRLIAKFSYKNTEQPVKSWVEMYQKVLQILYNEDKSIMTKLAFSDNAGLSVHFSTNESDFIKCVEIGDSIYVWTNTTTQSKLTVLRKIFTLYDADQSDLVFYLRDDNDDKETEVGTIYETRRKYWSFSLPYIKNVFNTDGPFSNVNPTNDNWINGYFGISGFCLTCIANNNSARVELTLAKKDQEINKNTFDYLYSNRDKIEKDIGHPLTWRRDDQKTSSKISYQMFDVSVEKEEDWQKMAEFHSTWCKKMFDILIPYIQNFSSLS